MPGSKEYQKQWCLENKDRLKKTKQEYYLRTKEQTREQRRLYAIERRKKDPATAMLVAAKYRSKQNNIPFNLESSDIILPELCPILGMPLQCHAGKGSNIKKDSYSLDRIDPTKGYTKGNVQVISGLANRMKQDATPEELIAFAEWVLKTYKET